MKRLNEYKALSEEDRALLTRCRSVVERIDPSAQIILYGSRARGGAKRESDYDLLIITDGEATLAREDIFRRRLFPLELETGAVLTVILVNRENWNSPLYEAMPFYQNVRTEGLML